MGERGAGRKRPYFYEKDPQKFLLVAELLTSMTMRNLPDLARRESSGRGTSVIVAMA